ncbi:metacaspase-9-like [Impatiens glandulifera]|uniref:metacaspase-9-like n=1 Tax=Impatiens glandulifera TaxID=253017 RepID=UPI001FB0F59E|nr:metacaspase-9-like [Impatiens glandulifera]
MMAAHPEESCGKRMAVVVGCNYPKTQFQLHGCINDALSMADLLVKRMGFDPLNIELLIDDHGHDHALMGMPTGENVKKALGRMIDCAQSGDVLFFHFSGHGTRTKSHHFREGEAIVPCRFNINVDFKLLVNRLPKGATFTILSDSCHSGGLIDQEKEQIGPSSSSSCLTQNKPKFIPYEAIVQHLSGFGDKDGAEFNFKSAVAVGTNWNGDGGILLSGCEAKESSMDIPGNGANGSRPHGAFTDAVVRELSAAGVPIMISNRELVMRVRDLLKKEKIIQQHPCLYSTDQNARSIFLGLPT